MSERESPTPAQLAQREFTSSVDRLFGQVDDELKSLRLEVETLISERDALTQTIESEQEALRSEVEALTLDRDVLARAIESDREALRSEVETLSSERDTLTRAVERVSRSLQIGEHSSEAESLASERECIELPPASSVDEPPEASPPPATMSARHQPASAAGSRPPKTKKRSSKKVVKHKDRLRRSRVRVGLLLLLFLVVVIAAGAFFIFSPNSLRLPWSKVAPTTQAEAMDATKYVADITCDFPKGTESCALVAPTHVFGFYSVTWHEYQPLSTSLNDYYTVRVVTAYRGKAAFTCLRISTTSDVYGITNHQCSVLAKQLDQ
jgi:hypothetical protein